MARNYQSFGGRESRAGTRRAAPQRPTMPTQAKQPAQAVVPQMGAIPQAVSKQRPTQTSTRAANPQMGIMPPTAQGTPQVNRQSPTRAAPTRAANPQLQQMPTQAQGAPQIPPMPFQAQGVPQVPQTMSQAVIPQQAQPMQGLFQGNPGAIPQNIALPTQAAAQAQEFANLGTSAAQQPRPPMPQLAPPMPGSGNGQVQPAVAPMPSFPKMPTASAAVNPGEMTKPWGTERPQNSQLQSLLSGFLSDETKKENIRDLSDDEALSKIGNIPVYKYNYKEEHRAAIGDHGEERLGPMAQDWAREFGGPSNVIAMPQMIGALVGAVRALDKRTSQKG